MTVSPIALTGAYYNQTFYSLPSHGTAGSSQLPQGWDFAARAGSMLIADDGGLPGSGVYSYGPDDSSDRAFGELSAGSNHPILGAGFVNATNHNIVDVAIDYVGEQWRAGGGQDRLDFQYSLDATSLTSGTWHDFNALDFVAPHTTGGPGALDGNDPANEAFLGSQFELNIAPGASFYIRWVPSDTSGTGNGLAIDNVSLHATFDTPTAKSDFNGDFHSDILWHNDNGSVSVWDSGQISGAHIVRYAGEIPNSWHVDGTADFFSAGTSDVVWRNDDGSVMITGDGWATLPDAVATDWHIAGTGHFDNGGGADILWRNDNGAVSLWDYGEISNAHIIVAAGVVSTSWQIAGTGDFDGDGHDDILWRNDNGAMSIWDSGQIDRAHIIAAAGVVSTSWHVAGTGDFNKDGHDDILWRNDNGAVSIWDNGQIDHAHVVAAAGVVSTSWHIADTGDYDGNGFADILWHNDNGAVSIWDNGQISNAHIIAAAGVVGNDWHIV